MERNSKKNIYSSYDRTKLKWFLPIFLAIILALLFLSPLNDIIGKLFNGLMPFFIALIVVFILKHPRKMVANKLLKNAELVQE